MAISDADLWHQVHAQREDGVAATFLIREIEPRPDQPQIFMVELPYPVTDPSKLPDEAAYRRLDTFQEQWLEPACESLGWTYVAWKSEDGSFFFYLYGNADPNVLLEKLAPFDEDLSFFNDRDAEWSEYAALRELVEQAEAAEGDDHVHTADCDHDHDTTSHPIPVIDLTGEPPAKPPASKRASAKPAAARAAAAKATKPAATKPTKPTTSSAKAAATKPAKVKPTKATASKAKPAAAKTTAAKTTSKAPATKATTTRAGIQQLASRSAAKNPTTSKPSASKPAPRLAANKPSKPRTPRK